MGFCSTNSEHGLPKALSYYIFTPSPGTFGPVAGACASVQTPYRPPGHPTAGSLLLAEKGNTGGVLKGSSLVHGNVRWSDTGRREVV